MGIPTIPSFIAVPQIARLVLHCLSMVYLNHVSLLKHCIKLRPFDQIIQRHVIIALRKHAFRLMMHDKLQLNSLAHLAQSIPEILLRNEILLSYFSLLTKVMLAMTSTLFKKSKIDSDINCLSIVAPDMTRTILAQNNRSYSAFLIKASCVGMKRARQTAAKLALAR